MAFAVPGRPTVIREGAVEGIIATTPRGAGGFGYDPLFFYPPFGCTLAEAPPEQKMSVSHRGRALQGLFEWLGRLPASGSALSLNADP
jgi:XTP/dITP diphosphohydrolase